MSNDKLQVHTVIVQILRRFTAKTVSIIFFTIFSILVASTCTVIAPYVFSSVIDKATDNIIAQDLFSGFALYALLIGVSFAFGQIIKYLATIAAENITLISSTNFFGSLLKKETPFFAEYNATEIQSAQTQGTEAINMIVQIGLIYIVPTIVQLVLTLIILSSKLNLMISFIVILYGFIYILLVYFTNKWTRPHLQKATAAIQQNAKFVGNIIPSLETLRFFGSALWIGERFNNTAHKIYKNWWDFCIKHICFCILYGLAISFQFLITYSLLLPDYKSGVLSIGDLVLFNILLLQLNQPFEMVGLSIDSFIRAFVKLVPFAKIWFAPEEREIANSKIFEANKGQLEFKCVGFKYDNGRGIDNVSFSASRGKITFLIGATGAGKSTILKLALRSLCPQIGSIEIDGQNLSKISRLNWYSKVGIVPQEVILLNESLVTNIILGRKYDEQRLVNAARRAAIFDRINAMPDKFDTIIGERGLKLSGGERQRIAIARALYSNPAFLFLDEASSALDDATEKQIMQEIRLLTNEITIIVITHRKNIVSSHDQVIEIKGLSN